MEKEDRIRILEKEYVVEQRKGARLMKSIKYLRPDDAFDLRSVFDVKHVPQVMIMRSLLGRNSCSSAIGQHRIYIYIYISLVIKRYNRDARYANYSEILSWT